MRWALGACRRAAAGRVVLVALALLGAAGSARGQVLPDQSATRGPEIPVGTLAGDAEATQVVLEAANLAFLSSWNVMGMYTYIPDSVARGPSGGGLYAATPVPLLERLAVGAAVEIMRPGRAFPFGDAGRLTLALAVRALPALSLGLSWSHVFGGLQGDADTADVSLAARLSRWAALSLVVHDLPGPVVHDLPGPVFARREVQRVYQGELAVRPLGSYRFELAVSARVGERRGQLDPALRLQFVPVPGLTVRGQLEYARDLDGNGVPENALRGTLGLQLDFTIFGFAAYALAGTAGNGNFDGQLHGVAATARVSGDRWPALYRPRRFERIDISGGSTSSRRLPRLLDHLRRLAGDPSTDGILAVIGSPDGGWATMEELRGAFARLRLAGKRVVVFGAELSNKGYYAAAAAERILLDPGGGVHLLGLQSQALYFKGALDKLGVRADLVKIAEYKAAPEQLTREGGSDEAREVRAAILDDIDRRFVANLAADRHLDPSRITALRDAGPFTAQGAARAGLVDELRSGDEVEAALSRLVGGRAVVVLPPDGRRQRPGSFSPLAVAVVHVDGDIVEGKSRSLPFSIPFIGGRVAGHESLLAAIAAARSDERVRAIVVRIDSPGGSALAADLVARELFRTRAVKPVICSLGDTAASGGYYIASSCDTVFADPSTITGSIGIFGGKIDVSVLARKLGITTEVAKRGAHADLDTWFRPYTDDERAALLDRLREAYQRFVGAVAAGRGLKPEQVELVARGRVWTGAQARERHLVDAPGGFLDALALAAKRGGLAPRADFELLALPEEPSTLLGQLAQLLGIRVAESESQDVPEAVRRLLSLAPVSLLLAPSSPQARLPFNLLP